MGQMVTVKRWGDFLSARLKRESHDMAALTGLNLEVAIKARKSRNYRTANSFLELALGAAGTGQPVTGNNYTL